MRRLCTSRRCFWRDERKKHVAECINRRNVLVVVDEVEEMEEGQRRGWMKEGR